MKLLPIKALLPLLTCCRMQAAAFSAGAECKQHCVHHWRTAAHEQYPSTRISHLQVYLAGSSAAHQQIIDRGAWPAQSPKLDLLCVSHGSALSVCTWGLFPVAGLDIMPVAGVAPGKQAPVTIVKVKAALQ